MMRQKRKSIVTNKEKDYDKDQGISLFILQENKNIIGLFLMLF
jgi:hypothetical protein